MPLAKTWLIVLGLVVLTALPFSRVCWSDFVNYDDPTYVTENVHVQQGLTARSAWWALTSLDAVNWHPLTWFSYQLDWELYGNHPAGFHLTNLLLHLANVVLLFAGLRALTGTTWPSALAASLFALHPLRIEPVAWVSARKDLLSTFFFLLILLAYARYVRRPSAVGYALVLVLFALGLMAKSNLVVAPGLLLLLDFWPLRRLEMGTKLGWPSVRGCLLEKLPLLALAAGCAILAWRGQQESFAPRHSLTLGTRVLMACVFYVEYLGDFFYPLHLVPYHPYPTSSLPLWQILGSVLLLATIALLAVRMVRWHPYFLAGWLWYLGMMLPTIGLAEIVGGQGRADRYTYVPYIGLFVIVAWGAEMLLARRWACALVVSAATAVLCVFLTLDWINVGYWRDSLTLWSHAARIEPDNYFAQMMWGDALVREGDIADASARLDEARRLNPRYSVLANYLGGLAMKQGQVDLAITYFREAVSLNPRDVPAYNSLGKLLRQKGKHDEAFHCFQQAVTVAPHFPEARNNLGFALFSAGKTPEAIEQYQAALSLEPNFADAHYNLAIALARQGQLDQAVQHCETALRLAPENGPAHYNLAFFLEQRGRVGEALEHYDQAVRLDPSSGTAREALARTLATLGKFNEAIQQYQNAVRLQSENPELYFGLGMIYLEQRNWEKAESSFREAVSLRSSLARYHSHLALALQRRGDERQAAEQYQEALRLDPDWPRRYNARAWQLATAPQGSRREGLLAVILADQACQAVQEKEPQFLDTLAAAHAQAGSYDKAREIGRRALQLASSPAQAQAIQVRLATYARSQPFHGPRGTKAP